MGPEIYKEVSVELRRRWKLLTDDVQQSYIFEAERLRILHQKDYPNNPGTKHAQFLSASGALCFKRWSAFISSSRSSWSPWSSRSLQFRVIVNLFARKGSKANKSCLACCSR